MSVNGLVNFGTILEVVNDLKPCAEIKARDEKGISNNNNYYKPS